MTVAGAVGEDSAFGYLSEFLEALQPFEERMHELLEAPKQKPEPVLAEVSQPAAGTTIVAKG
jgi:hypothetical protein